MRFHRVRLKNFCGVVEADVKFAPTGVTLVHGPNEAGKSTLMHGISVLFDHRDDSKKEEVRLTKPVNRDVGSEVEAEVTVGEHMFTYFKRFHRERETRLTIHEPRPENLVGREAHERVQEILSSNVDTALWQALRIVQGCNLELPELHRQPALAQALDRAAGQAKSGEKEEALFAAAYSEYAQYFTDTGKEKEDPIGQLRKSAAQAADKERELLGQLKEIEEDVSRFATLEKSTAALKGSVAKLETAQQKSQADWDQISTLAEGVERAKAAHQSAGQSVQLTKNAIQRRHELMRTVESAARKLDETKKENDESTQAFVDATESLRIAVESRDAARTAGRQREAEEIIRRADFEFRTEAFDLVLMQERLDHVAQADAAAAVASGVMAVTKITDKLRAAIRDAEVGMKTAQGILSSASPQFTIKALKSVAVNLNGDAQTIAAGDERLLLVIEPVVVTIADSVELRVDPGASAELQRQAVSDAANVLAKACAKAGVADPDEAETAWASLQEANRAINDRNRIAKQHLRDLTREALANLVRVATAKVAAYPAKRSAAFPLPATSEDAKVLLETARTAAAQARKAMQETEAVFAPVQEHHGKCREVHAANTALFGQAGKDHALAVAQLEAERIVLTDEALARALEIAQTAATHALNDLKLAEANLGNADLESAEDILKTSVSALKKTKDECEAQDRALLALRTKLDLVGDKGLAEAVAEQQRVAFEARDSLNRLLRRAGAARLLYDTLCAEREAMRKAYVAPLREGIGRLGRHVFGPTLRVDVDENLCVASRTVDTVTVGFDQLSTGAREQMGLLVRLAVASIVSKDGGVPLVLDDALGSTDEGRFASLGAVLRIASQNVQTIILTCAPERYVHVGAEVSVAM